jgi:hypothetical protein
VLLIAQQLGDVSANLALSELGEASEERRGAEN